jgi:hypothetical protein
LLQLLAVAAVEQRVVGIRRDLEDQRQLFGRQSAGTARGKLARRRLRRLPSHILAGLPLLRPPLMFAAIVPRWLQKMSLGSDVPPFGTGCPTAQ